MARTSAAKVTASLLFASSMAAIACGIDVGGRAASGGDGGAAACAHDEDCAPLVTDPPGCAVSRCEAGRCHASAADADGDGHRRAVCGASGVVVETGDDCDDTDANVHPGAWDGPPDPADGVARPNRCDAKDEDCNGKVDDGRYTRADTSVVTCACDTGQPIACATSPDGTPIGGLTAAKNGVGICRLGVLDCVDGIVGACRGARGPEEEACGTPEDEDCGGGAPDCGGPLKAIGVGDGASQNGDAIATDATHVFVALDFAGTVRLGADSHTSLGGIDALVAKMDAAGQAVWTRRFGGAGDQLPTSIAADGQGGAWVAGRFETAIALGTGATPASSGGTDAWLVHLNAAGDAVLGKTYGGSGDERITSVALDPQGNVLVAGYFTSSVDFGGELLTSAGSTDVFVAKLQPSGARTWSKRFGDAAAQGAYALATDADGAVLLVGSTVSSLNFGTGALAVAGGSDAFAVKIDAAGATSWARTYGDALDQGASSVAASPDGSVLVAGQFRGAMSLGGGVALTAQGTDAYVVKLAKADGAAVWGRAYGDSAFQAAYGVAVDARGSVLVTGEADGRVDFGGGALVSAGSGDVFALRLDKDGKHLWSRRFGDGAAQFGGAIAADPASNAWITGSFAGALDGAGLTSAGSFDAFVLNLAR